ncbi:NAD(P)/FAD-dependent oxidoreductase [Cytophaga aurantiaca]|uniref:NAD(P)/FAD-dependent oxidoreductase n=1 Tax=Cytophaga aurantiaca TaxID=29530 RepID=UPI000369F784|nr:TIGR03862 family flavoprotein [Cytophaga aurantiaca]
MKKVAIIGGGPSALMLAAMLDEKKYAVHIYEKNAAVGRKFLVAGDGGFNLTHSESIDLFVARYTPNNFLEEALRAFTNQNLCDWLKNIGIETYTGSSKRIFPVKGIKPIEVLNAFLKKLTEKNVQIHTLHEWKGWNEKNQIVFQNKKENIHVDADMIVFALGGASWSVTGSDGTWLNLFQKKGIDVVPFQASNCGYTIQWPDVFIEKQEGKWLKNISVVCGDKQKQGELVITKSGIEGGAIYALSPEIRKQLSQKNVAEIAIDFKPTFSKEDLVQKLSAKSKKSVTEILGKEINLSDVQITMLKVFLSKEDFIAVDKLAEYIKHFPLSITGRVPIDEAISTVGGIPLTEVDENFQLKKIPNQYVLGEMLDWDAPTGGYLLQGCFSMGAWVAGKVNGAHD